MHKFFKYFMLLMTVYTFMGLSTLQNISYFTNWMGDVTIKLNITASEEESETSNSNEVKEVKEVLFNHRNKLAISQYNNVLNLEFSNHKSYDLFGTFKFDMSLPLQSKNEIYTNYLTPRMSLRYSPNGNNDISSKDIKLNYNNAFSLNRIRSDSQVEGDEALTIGLEFQKEKNMIGNVLEFRIGNVLKAKNSNNLPKKSKLNEIINAILQMTIFTYTEILLIDFE